MYMRMFDGWLVENKHGSVVQTMSTSGGKSNGSVLSGSKLVPRKRADGSLKVCAEAVVPLSDSVCTRSARRWHVSADDALCACIWTPRSRQVARPELLVAWLLENS